MKLFSHPLLNKIRPLLPDLLAICAVIGGRFLVDTQWNMPRVGFSVLLYFFFAAFLQRWAAVAATLALEGLLLNISYIKEVATSEPLLGADLFEVGQGMAMTDYMNWQIWAYALITIGAIGYGLWRRPRLSKTRLSLALALCVFIEHAIGSDRQTIGVC
ncbi:hypothetical protein [Deefgea sp. CFH1-16]|uniref:hypothetical protein n=1 Tax=Deefgea sp. CFH1-16 TaxID=2675457 RepID=UPI0015F424D6|nr:hypothetical protein [Deefgea sp. CFH1-16]MBM5574373.1 hypothetical protein [Deefgea sp. CFH1-16]